MFISPAGRWAHARSRAIVLASLDGNARSLHRQVHSRGVGQAAVRRGFSRCHVDVCRGVSGELRLQPIASDFHQTFEGSSGSLAQAEGALPEPLAGR